MSLYSGAALILNQKDHERQADRGPETKERIPDVIVDEQLLDRNVFLCRERADLTSG